MVVKDVLDKTTQFFKERKIESARLDSEILIAKALGFRRIDLYLKFEQPLKEEEIQACRDLVKRRSQGEPVAYILGHKDFYNLTFEVDSRVLVPRPETESLVEMALDWMKAKDQDKFDVVDLGCGSGCIGLTVAKNEVRSEVLMLDSSEGAVEISQKNKEKLEVTNADIQKSEVESFDFKNKKFDVVLANPPYIDSQDTNIEDGVKKFEPAAALFSPEQGLSAIYKWSEKLSNHLKPHGLMIFEIGYDQGEKAKKHFESLQKFSSVTVVKDMSGHDRFIKAENYG